MDVLARPGTFIFLAPTKVIHGRGSVTLIGAEVAQVARRPLVVTDAGIVSSGIADRVTRSLEKAELAPRVFGGVTHTASVEAVNAAVTEGRAHDFDAVVGVGGGSALAVARGVAIVGAMGRPVREIARLPLRMLPLFSIPTTAGSGSEVSPSAPLVDHELSAKITLSGPNTYSRVAILDAELLASLPAGQAALSGVDALAHAIEAFCTNLATPITDALALAAMTTFMRDLRAAVEGDLDARERCLVASTMANQACGNAKLGLVHGLARNVQTLFTIPYGVTIAVFLVPVMEFNVAAVPERFARMARACGVASEAARESDAAEAMIAATRALLADIKVPTRFSREQVDGGRVEELARMVFARNTDAQLDPSALARLDVSGYAPSPNIRRATFADLVSLYRGAIEGA